MQATINMVTKLVTSAFTVNGINVFMQHENLVYKFCAQQMQSWNIMFIMSLLYELNNYIN